MMHREEFERKRRENFLERMKHLYNGKDGTEPELQAIIKRDYYTTKLARKLYELLRNEEINVRREILHKLNDLFKF